MRVALSELRNCENFCVLRKLCRTQRPQHFHSCSFTQIRIASFYRLSKRLLKNADHFQSNYVFVFLVLFIYCLVTSPLLLIVLAAAGGACYIASLKQVWCFKPTQYLFPIFSNSLFFIAYMAQCSCRYFFPFCLCDLSVVK